MADAEASAPKKVAYYYDKSVGDHYYGQGHPMKPHRMRMTHNLLLHYDLHKELEMFVPQRTDPKDLTMFHSDEYIDFLRTITPDRQHEHLRELKRFNVGEDCPVFDGVFQFCQISAGGSIGGAHRLNNKLNDIVINWSGGLHHAKKTEASGFCYVNDIVLAILELLKHHQEAFYTTDRVMTVSFHKFGDYFPGTGHLADVGQADGKYYALNVPLKDGIDDASYEQLFKPLMSKVMEMYKPDAIVFQSGADSLSGDRLGCFNLSIKGHAECVRFMKTFGVPMLVLGGGGYTIRNVARCWCYETGVLVGTEIEDKMPYNDYYEYFGPAYRLHMQASNMENQNSVEYLNTVRSRLLDNLSRISPAPSVPMHAVPPDSARAVAEAEAAEAAADARDPDADAGARGEGGEGEGGASGGRARRDAHGGEEDEAAAKAEAAAAAQPAEAAAAAMETDGGEAEAPADGAGDADAADGGDDGAAPME